MAINLLANKLTARNITQLGSVLANKERELLHFGVHSVNLFESDWYQLLEHERIPYLMREIRTKLTDANDSSLYINE